MKWFSNFIKDRNYLIKIRNNYSTSYTIDHVVPLVSIHSPTIFSIYLIPLQTIMKCYLKLIRRRHRTTRNDDKLYPTTKLFK